MFVIGKDKPVISRIRRGLIMNVMAKPRIQKATVNIGVGEGGEN